MERDPTPEAIRSTTIGKYRLFASLGRGGMADVYLAVARSPMGFNELTVIKRLRAEVAADASIANMPAPTRSPAPVVPPPSAPVAPPADGGTVGTTPLVHVAAPAGTHDETVSRRLGFE